LLFNSFGYLRWEFTSKESQSGWDVPEAKTEEDQTIAKAYARTKTSPMQGSIFDDANCGGRMKKQRLGYVAALFLASAGSILLAGCGGGTAPSNITIEIIRPSTGTAVDVGSTQTLDFTATLAEDTQNQGVTWTLSGSSCSGSGCGSLSNEQPFSVSFTAPTALPSSTAVSVTLTATSVADSRVTATATITVQPAPAFSTTICNPAGVTDPCGLPAGANGVAYNQSIQITGGVGPYTFAVVSGALPDCLTMNLGPTTSLTTSIVGKPCNSGPYSFTLQVTDSGGAAPVTQNYSLSISAAPPLSIVTTSLLNATLKVAYDQPISVTGGVSPLTWSKVSGDLPPGLSLSPTLGRITGTPTVQAVSYPYTYSFTVQVQDSALLPPDSHHQTATQALSITVQEPLPLSILTPTGPLTGGTTGAAYNFSLQGSGGVVPYTWTVIEGQLPSGLTLYSTGSISGTPVIVGTSKFTVQLSDSVGSTPTSAQFSIAITAGANNNGLFNGQYSFQFNGFDAEGPVMMAGTLTADGAGNIAAGAEVSNRNSGVVTGASVSGCYAIGSDGRGTLELTSTFGPNNSSLTADYTLALESDGTIRFIQYHPSPAPSPCSNAPAGATADGATNGQGVLKPVSATTFGASSFSGNYAFEFPGHDLSGNRAALAGVIHANGTTQTLTPGTCDFNDAGTYGSQSLSGDFTFTSSNIGNATMTFVVPTKSQITLHFVYFFVSPRDLLFIETDADTNTGKPTNYRLSGEMILQPTGTTFGQASLAGASVATASGVDGSGNAVVGAGVLTSTSCDGTTQNTLDYDQNDAGASASASLLETCTVASNGRVAFTWNESAPPIPAQAPPFAAAYLTGMGQGFLIGSDAAVTTGLLEQQSPGISFSSSSVQGGYALSAPLAAEAQVTNLSGQVDADGAGNVTGTVDANDSAGTSTLDQALGATVSAPDSTGRGTMTTNAPTGMPTNLVFYIVSPGKIRAISADASNQHPAVIFFEH
jgi:hypothetical protein